MNASAERRARNEALFRDANEEIRDSQRRLAADVPRVPFMCECADTSCRELVPLAIEDYEAVRAHAERFLVVAGHDGGTVVARGDGWSVIEKEGREAEIARETDPRS